ncbi:hypothetical protein JW978_03085 [Candidatus Dojkabacteria bacterium]|nr:hypothetical protein [Candidatus Dojkabacteria bacterium]
MSEEAAPAGQQRDNSLNTGAEIRSEVPINNETLLGDVDSQYQNQVDCPYSPDDGSGNAHMGSGMGEEADYGWSGSDF